VLPEKFALAACDAARDAVVGFDASGQLVLANTAARAVLGERVPEELAAYVKQVLAGARVRDAVLNVEGARFLVDGHSFGEGEGALLSFRPPSAVGDAHLLLGAAVHELNNPLAYTLLNVEQALDALSAIAGTEPPALDEAKKRLQEALEGVQRIDRVVRGLGTIRPPQPSVRPAPDAATKRARILVIDDEPSLANALGRALRAGHDVKVSWSPAEELAEIEAGARYDLIFCDLMMPLVSGMDMHDRIAALDPEQARRMVFMTGGAFTPEAQAFLERVQNPRVVKPFDASRLRADLQLWLSRLA
jgi:CheY-like chemotaxis protein